MLPLAHVPVRNGSRPKAFNGSAATADEFANVAFGVSFRGYHRAQVDEVLADRLRELRENPTPGIADG